MQDTQGIVIQNLLMYMIRNAPEEKPTQEHELEVTDYFIVVKKFVYPLTIKFISQNSEQWQQSKV